MPKTLAACAMLLHVLVLGFCPAACSDSEAVRSDVSREADGAASQGGGSAVPPVFRLLDLQARGEAPHLILDGWLVAKNRMGITAPSRLTYHVDLDVMEASISEAESFDGWHAAVEAGAAADNAWETIPNDSVSAIQTDFDVVLATLRAGPAVDAAEGEEWGTAVLSFLPSLGRRVALYWPFNSRGSWTNPEAPFFVDCATQPCKWYRVTFATGAAPEVGLQAYVWSYQDSGEAGRPPLARGSITTPELEEHCAAWTLKPINDWSSFVDCDWLELLVNGDYYRAPSQVAEPTDTRP